MFTGLIEAIGAIQSWDQSSGRVCIAAPFSGQLSCGESVAVDGVCLTVTEFDATSFCADVMPETISASTLGQLRVGQRVNLERALAANGRFGGHIVAGHVDARSELLQRRESDGWVVLRFSLNVEVAPLVAYKGSVALAGVSLTVSAVGRDWFEVSLIPQTLQDTTLGRLSEGETVNLETDTMARYAQRLRQFEETK